jgi:hypothetical protein
VGLIDDLIRIAYGEVSVELLSIVNKKSSCGYATHFFILNSKSMNSSVHGSVLNLLVSSLSYIHRYRRKMFFCMIGKVRLKQQHLKILFVDQNMKRK